jgi:hypothetical protein
LERGLLSFSEMSNIDIDDVAEKEELLGDCISLLWEDPNRFLVPDDYNSRLNARA